MCKISTYLRYILTTYVLDTVVLYIQCHQCTRIMSNTLLPTYLCFNDSTALGRWNLTGTLMLVLVLMLVLMLTRGQHDK